MAVSGFTHESLPGRILFGAGSIDRLTEEVDALGAGRLLLIASRSAAGVALGPRPVARIDGVAPHVPAEAAESARELALTSGADGLVCIGGGSATGLAKAVAAVTGLPIVAVPTTYAGSEVTASYGITGADGKVVRQDARALPRTVLYDPGLTVGLPAHVTAASGLNAIAHCVAALAGTDPVARCHATEGLTRLVDALPRAVEAPDDLDARADAMLGAHFAGRALAGAGVSLHHRLCHAIGGLYGIVHAEIHAALLPYAIDPAARERVAAVLGVPDAAAGIYDLAVALGIRMGLGSIGVPREAVEGQHRTLLAAAYEGRRPTVQNGVEYVGRNEV